MAWKETVHGVLPGMYSFSSYWEKLSFFTFYNSFTCKTADSKNI